MKKALILALLSFYALLSGVSHAREYKSMTVRIACSTPPGSVQAVPLERLAEIVHNESNGRIKCELYTGGVLGDEQSVVKQLRGNEIQIGVLAADSFCSQSHAGYPSLYVSLKATCLQVFPKRGIHEDV